jgi:nitroreductase
MAADNGTYRTIISKRDTPAFTGDPVPPETLRRIVQAGRMAGSSRHGLALGRPGVYSRATARNGRDFLHQVRDRMPFPVNYTRLPEAGARSIVSRRRGRSGGRFST